MEPSPPSIESDSSTWQESNRKKRRRSKQDPEDVNVSTLRFSGDNENRNDAAKKRRWRTDREMLVYSSKLIDALRRVRSRNDSASTSGRGGGEIRKTADRVLAVSAKGTTRWSRAILASRLKTARRRSIVNKHIKKAKKRENTCRRLIVEKRRLPAVQKRVKTLSQLVPGCRKVSLTNLLGEASDYIAALQMQVKAMTALSEILTGVAPSGDRIGLPSQMLIFD